MSEEKATPRGVWPARALAGGLLSWVTWLGFVNVFLPSRDTGLFEARAASRRSRWSGERYGPELNRFC